MPTESFQITGEREAPPGALDEKKWRLVITGLVKTPRTLTLNDVQNLATRQLETDIHCVTGWSYKGMRFTGFPLEILLDLVRPTPEAKYVWFGAYSPRNHDTSLPLDLAREDSVEFNIEVDRLPTFDGTFLQRSSDVPMMYEVLWEDVKYTGDRKDDDGDGLVDEELKNFIEPY